jgi:hypothetical protein
VDETSLEGWLKFILALGFLMISLGYLYRPSWILRVNNWARSLIFNDSHVLHYRRRWGLLFFFAAALLFYSALNNLSHPTADRRAARAAALEDSHR